jgi:hypothetical protein
MKPSLAEQLSAELYADLGKECYKPFAGIIGKKTSKS